MTALTGTGGLVRLILRRDRFVLPAWIVVLTLIPINFVKATESLYPTAADRLQYAHTSGTNPTFLALYGPLYSPDLGGIIAQRCGFIPVIIGLISALTVVRHTRAEEEAGRRELLGATVTGRGAGLAAALLVTMAANLVLAALLTAGMAAQGLPLAGSLAFGLQLAAAGCVFAAVAGVTAQLSEGAAPPAGRPSPRSAPRSRSGWPPTSAAPGNGLSWLGWLSPLGWGTRVRAYGGGALVDARTRRGPRRRPGRRGPACCRPGGTWARACCRRSSAPPTGPAGCRGRSASGGGCRAAPCTGGSRGSPCSASCTARWRAASGT
ncbi:hypothetical protein [Actinomadura madurae]|uniref:hypothetical protein n=1 Tax=Actinomadura madurae TaxID=1993 RepID=UPI0020D1FBE8|nr:hypothetical protein [Actinomadura madurae]MCP9983135.1 hypothetical protein [Actinomadura madurae]